MKIVTFTCSKCLFALTVNYDVQINFCADCGALLEKIKPDAHEAFDNTDPTERIKEIKSQADNLKRRSLDLNKELNQYLYGDGLKDGPTNWDNELKTLKRAREL